MYICYLSLTLKAESKELYSLASPRLVSELTDKKNIGFEPKITSFKSQFCYLSAK